MLIRRNTGAPVGPILSGFVRLTSATGAGSRRDASTGDALAHIAHDRLWIRSHAVTLDRKSVAPNIRRLFKLVNEMGIQFLDRDVSAILRKRCKKDGTILRRP
jgi:RecA/RadA recombinase